MSQLAVPGHLGFLEAGGDGGNVQASGSRVRSTQVSGRSVRDRSYVRRGQIARR